MNSMFKLIHRIKVQYTGFIGSFCTIIVFPYYIKNWSNLFSIKYAIDFLSSIVCIPNKLQIPPKH